MITGNYISWGELTEEEQSDYAGQEWAKDACFFRFNGKVYDYDSFGDITIDTLADWGGEEFVGKTIKVQIIYRTVGQTNRSIK